MIIDLNFQFMHRFHKLFIALLLLGAANVMGASVKISVLKKGGLTNEGTVSSDPAYADQESVSLAVNTSSDGSVVITGRSYAEDGAAVGRYGLLDGTSPKNLATSGFVLRGGLVPNAIGSTLSTFTGVRGVPGVTAASYLSFKMTAPAGTQFTQLTLDISGFDFNLPSRIWAGTSVNNFGQATLATHSVKGGVTNFSFNFASLTPNSQEMELRVYGLAGADEAQLRDVTINGTVGNLTAVPEPGSAVLLVSATLAACLIRRRRTEA